MDCKLPMDHWMQSWVWCLLSALVSWDEPAGCIAMVTPPSMVNSLICWKPVEFFCIAHPVNCVCLLCMLPRDAISVNGWGLCFCCFTAKCTDPSSCFLVTPGRLCWVYRNLGATSQGGLFPTSRASKVPRLSKWHWPNFKFSHTFSSTGKSTFCFHVAEEKDWSS